MKIEGYTVQFNTSATQYKGQLIEAVPFWRLYLVNRSDRHHPVHTAIGVFSMHELQLYFRNMYDKNIKLAPGCSFEAYARASIFTNRKRNSKSLKELEKKIRQLERRLAKLGQ